MGRPKKTKKDRRIVLSISLYPPDLAALKRQAKAKALSLAETVRGFIRSL